VDKNLGCCFNCRVAPHFKNAMRTGMPRTHLKISATTQLQTTVCMHGRTLKSSHHKIFEERVRNDPLKNTVSCAG
jgi:hypothetical protein